MEGSHMMNTKSDCIICPYCGHMECTTWDINLDDEIYECEKCEKKSYLFIEKTITFETKPYEWDGEL